MTLTRRTFTASALAAAPLLAATGCARDAVDASAAKDSRGPITIWVSNNEQEVEWGQAVAKAWTDEHPDEEVRCQEIPAGASSEEAISAAIVAGTTPDLVFNASPAALPDWVRAEGLVDLASFDGAREHIENRAGTRARIYAEGDSYYQLPWKSNPVMVMFNRDLFSEAGIDPDEPDMSTFDTFLDGARKIVESTSARSAVWPEPTSEFFQPWFDFYPVYLAQTGGTMLIEDGSTTFDSPDGVAVAEFWRQLYAEDLAPQESATDDAMTTAQTAMAFTGPYAIATYQDVVDYGFMPVPTKDGIADSDTITFSDAKNIAMFSTSTNRRTAWEFLEFATSKEMDGLLLELSGQMPLRKDLLEAYPDYFDEHPDYISFADQADRVGDVPYLSGSTEIWQRFRDEYSGAVIFGKDPVDGALSDAAEQIDSLTEE
jgi:multiple sugar transport system substrate-binding protein